MKHVNFEIRAIQHKSTSLYSGVTTAPADPAMRGAHDGWEARRWGDP